MDLIHQNPFRVLGLPITATDREIAKSISDLSIFMKMGKTKEFDCDYFFPVKPLRTSEAIDNASKKIEQPNNKLFYALFWFWENPTNTIDEMAFEELKKGNVEKAIQFWEKATNNGVSSRNISNHKNLAVLYLGLASENGRLDKTMFLKSVSLSGKFLANGYFEEFIQHLVGSKHSIDPLEIIDSYVDEIISLVKPHLNNTEGLKANELIKSFTSYAGEIQSVILDKFIGKHIHNIEHQIQVTESKRRGNIADANEAGFELFEKTIEDIVYLSSVLSESDLEYQLIADKLATEITECSICYFNEFHGSETDPGDDALNLIELAKSIAVGAKVKERIDEGMPILRKYVNEKPKREKLKKVKEEVDYIYERIYNLQAERSIPGIAKTFLIACLAKLNRIKDELGETDADYLEICDMVVNNTIGMCIEYLNEVTKQSSLPGTFYVNGKFITIGEILSKVKPIFDMVGQLDMSRSTRSKYDELCTKIKPRQTTSSNSGCYIATMVYGSYNAPEVMVLRKFRDKVLLQDWIGQWVLRIYYKYSPFLVAKTKHLKTIHVVFKSILDPFVNYLKAKDE